MSTRGRRTHEPGHRPASFLAELKRRRVVRAALVYLAGAFAALQAADVLVPALHLPAWLVSAVAVLVIVGFPLVLALSWTFDLTPEGVKRATDAAVATAPAGAPAAWVGRRTVAATAVLVIFGVGLGAGLVLQPAGNGNGRDGGPITLAVLPFSNLSGDAATEPFVLGVHDDLLTQLSRLAALRVISRTSVLEYRDSPKNIRTIAAELGAGAVLEGGVQRSGDRIRLNVQLIDGRTDGHLWAQTYDRALNAENVFAIQADIARSIAQALQAELAPAEEAVLAAPPTSSLAALEAYHSGRDAFMTSTRGRTEISWRMFERAVELDPEFADAWAGLASARSWLVREGRDRDTASALEALERARELAPRATATRLAEAYFHYYARADLARAREAFRTVLEAAPADMDAIFGLALVERRLGRLEQAIPLMREAARLDPRNSSPPLELGYTLALAGQRTEAVPLLEQALRLSPDDVAANATMFGVLFWELGDTLSARRFAESSILYHGEQGPVWRAELAIVQRDWARAAAAADSMISPGIWSYGGYFAIDRHLFQTKIAYLAGDRAALRRWAQATLVHTDSLAVTVEGVGDRWGEQTGLHLRRALAYAFAGDSARALAAAAEAAHFTAGSDYLSSMVVLDHLVVVDMLTGRHEAALDGIERLLGMPSFLTPARLRMHPVYDPLRRHPRFRALAGEAT